MVRRSPVSLGSIFTWVAPACNFLRLSDQSGKIIPVPDRIASSPAAGRESARVAASLQALDWDFPGPRKVEPLEGIHPYPAKFVPQIPGTLLDLLPIPKGTGVLDPFVGSGTTLVEAQRRGLPSTGVDLNPIACLISRVKTAPVPMDLPDVIAETVALANRTEGQHARPDIPNVDHWFDAGVQSRLSALEAAIEVSPESHRDPLRLALSSIIVRVSRQESDTRYAAIDKDVDADSVLDLFRTNAHRIYDSLSGRMWPLAPVKVIEEDSQAFSAASLDKSVGIVITSPPYPNAYEYWLYHKYRMYWLRRDPISVREAEIGARPHFFKKNPHTAEHFSQQMHDVLRGATNTMPSGGWLCVVVGTSRIHGQDVDNAALVSQVGHDLGFEDVVHLTREIAANRKSFNLSHARIKSESIIVMCKS